MRFLADENFNNQNFRGLLRRISSVNIVRVQDTELYGKEDTEVLDYAVQHNFFILTHDVNTMRGYYYERLEAGLAVPGLFLVSESKAVGAVIESLELILSVSDESEWAGGIHFLPL